MSFQMLEAFIGERRDGYLFRSRSGGPLADRNVLRRSLHPILKAMGWKDGTLAGFHAFRRFRVSYLRKQRTLEDLLQYWTGHGDKTVTDRYSKLSQDDEFRRSVAEQMGTGLPNEIFAEIAILYPVVPTDSHLQKSTQVLVI